MILSDINHLLDFVFGKAGVFFVLLLKGAIVFPDGRGMGDLRSLERMFFETWSTGRILPIMGSTTLKSFPTCFPEFFQHILYAYHFRVTHLEYFTDFGGILPTS